MTEFWQFQSQYLTSNNVKLQQHIFLLLKAECDIMVANTALKTSFAFFKSWMYALEKFQFCILWHSLDDNAK